MRRVEEGVAEAISIWHYKAVLAAEMPDRPCKPVIFAYAVACE